MNGKMSGFGLIFKVNSSIGNAWNLTGHFDKKDTIDFNKHHFFIRQFYNECVNCVICPNECDTFPIRMKPKSQIKFFPFL